MICAGLAVTLTQVINTNMAIYKLPTTVISSWYSSGIPALYNNIYDYIQWHEEIHNDMDTICYWFVLLFPSLLRILWEAYMLEDNKWSQCIHLICTDAYWLMGQSWWQSLSDTKCFWLIFCSWLWYILMMSCIITHIQSYELKGIALVTAVSLSTWDFHCTSCRICWVMLGTVWWPFVECDQTDYDIARVTFVHPVRVLILYHIVIFSCNQAAL